MSLTTAKLLTKPLRYTLVKLALFAAIVQAQPTPEWLEGVVCADQPKSCLVDIQKEQKSLEYMLQMAKNFIAEDFNEVGDPQSQSIPELVPSGLRTQHELDQIFAWAFDTTNIDLSYDDYIDRLSMAALSVNEHVRMALLTVAQDPALQTHKVMSVVPKELQKHEGSDVQADAIDAQCSKLCRQGTQESEINDCIGYCEVLLLNTIELQKYPQNSRYPQKVSMQRQSALLFEGTGEQQSASEDGEGLAMTPGAIPELTVADGRNKLMTRETFHLVMLMSVAAGCLFLFLMRMIQHQSKAEGHAYLPRPQPKHQSQRSGRQYLQPCDNNSANVGGYVPVTAPEEVKQDEAAVRDSPVQLKFD